MKWLIRGLLASCTLSLTVFLGGCSQSNETDAGIQGAAPPPDQAKSYENYGRGSMSDSKAAGNTDAK